MEQQLNINTPIYGLNTDNVDSQIKQGVFTYALNALNENFDGETLQISNEQSNTLCIDFPEGYKVVGCFNIQNIDRVVYYLTNPTTKNSIIAYTNNNECELNILLDDRVSKVYNGVTYYSDLIGFNINFPIQKIHAKTTNCTTQIYWTDDNQPMRYLDFDSLPYKELENPDNEFKPILIEGVIDANKMRVMPNFKIPTVTPTEVEIGGNLIMGVYQFAICYSNQLGETYTSYYNPSNPVSIFEQKTGQIFNQPTTKAISVKIENLDVSGVYDYFNLAVVKTINNITSAELIGTFPITSGTHTYTYTNSSEGVVKLDVVEILERYPVYETAQGSFVVDNIIGWYGLKANEKYNFQLIWNQVKVGWETHRIPYTNEQSYKNGINTALYRGYMRDEIYPLEGTFVFDNGKESERFHIPGRKAVASDLVLIDINNEDATLTKTECENPVKKPKWQVYNTGSSLGKYAQADEDCYIGKYEYGENAYWESEETYPNNPLIWGQDQDPNKPYYSQYGLAGKKIRHHKLPDSLITHIHNNNDTGFRGFEHDIYPIGFKIDADSLKAALESSNLPEEIKKKIVGFKIYRGNRANNKSIIAKGLFNNVGEYTYKSNSYYYPNYPYNDLGDDPFFAVSEPKHHGGKQESLRLKGFEKSDVKSRFTFHSPDTSFYQPSISNNGLILKTETIEYGNSYGKFLSLKDNAQYKFSTQDVVAIAGSISLMVAIHSLDEEPYFRDVDGIGAFKNAMDIMEKLLPYYNYGTYYTSVGLYNKYHAVENTGYKQRNIDFTKYLNDGINSVENGKNINNYRRESSVYVHTDKEIKLPHEYDEKISVDNSRYLPDENTKSITIKQYWDVIKPLLDSTNLLNLNNFTHTVAVFSVGIARDNFVNNIQPILGQFPVAIQSLILGTIAVIQDQEKVDPFMTCFGGPESYFSKVLQILKFTGTFDEVGSWANYETICQNYTQLNPQYPTTDDLLPMNLYLLTGKSPISNNNKVVKCHAYLKNFAFKALVMGSALYNVTLNTSQNESANNIDSDPTYKHLNKEKVADISSYYGSIKKVQPSQWGKIYSYSVIDTGYYQQLKKQNTYVTDYPTIFGGDIFINRFAYKSKLSVFNKTTVNQKDGADLNLKKEGNLGYPIFWISTEPMTTNLGITPEEVNQVFMSVGSINWTGIITKTVQAIGDTIAALGVGLLLTGGPLAPVGLGFMITGAIVSLVAGIWDIFSSANKAIGYAKMYIRFIKAIIEGLGIKDLNLDQATVNSLVQKGIIYQYIYGIPYFFVESEVNVDFRQALNDREGNFYPNVGGFIPEDWTQETNVPIINDNVYSYNQSYSKQNDLFKDVIPRLREDYDPSKKCFTEFPNRAIWADKFFQEETKNHWLIYKPAARYDLPKENGNLTSIDTLENKQLLVRFTNKSQLYNALTTVEVSAGPSAYLGNSNLFSGSLPLDLANTDIGYAGSQHVALWKTEYGHIFTNSKRGQILNIQGTQTIDIADKGMDKWFSQWLPFKISEYDSSAKTDNAYNGAGITGVYDAFYKRLLLTKKDYKVINNCVAYDDNIGWYDKCAELKCPDGYTLIGDKCIKTETIEGPVSYMCPKDWVLEGNKCVKYIIGTPDETAPPINNSQTYNVYPKYFYTWGKFGAAIFSSVNQYGIGPHVIKMLPFWINKLQQPNGIALWTSPNQPVVNQWVGFETCITVPTTKTYFIALAADNIYRFKLDGNVVLTLESNTPNKYSIVQNYTSQFNLKTVTAQNFEANFSGAYQLFGVFPITLTAGSHKISLEAKDFGNPGMFAAEIYDNTYQDLINATSDNNLNILFSTRNKTSFKTPNYTCPKGFEYTAGATPCDLPQCKKKGTPGEVQQIDAIPVIDTYTVTTEAPVIYTPIDINDETYFKDVSWTISYSFLTQSWTSWHSYTPNYYISYQNYFQTGDNKLESLWNHNQTYTSFHNYYGTQYPYIIEYPFYYQGGVDNILQSIKEYCTSRKYIDFTTYYEPDETIYFNKAIVYNNQGNSGLRILKPVNKNDLSSYQGRIKYNTTSIEIPVTKKDNNFIYNDIWNVVKDLSQPMFTTTTDFKLSNKDLNQSNMDYNQMSFKKAPLRAHMSRVRHILDDKSEYKLINKFIIEETKQSYS